MTGRSCIGPGPGYLPFPLPSALCHLSEVPLPARIIKIAVVGRQRVVVESLSRLIAVEPDLRVLDEEGYDEAGLPEEANLALFDLDEAEQFKGTFPR